MPSLNWIGREAILKQHNNEILYRVLRYNAELSVGDSQLQINSRQSPNLLIEVDNLEALKAVLPYYGGQVKCIYIDPPYNTGNERWIYNDAVDSEAMQAWLGKTVDRDDLSRHDKWLCMMYPRLQLPWKLLSEDGSLWMSICCNEVHHARALLDEVFGERNFMATVIWQKMFSPKSSARHLSANHDYILLYVKSADVWQRNLLMRTEAHDKRYGNPDNDPRGSWASSDLSGRNYYSLGTYSITVPSGRVISGPPKGTYWRVSQSSLFLRHMVDDFIARRYSLEQLVHDRFRLREVAHAKIANYRNADWRAGFQLCLLPEMRSQLGVSPQYAFRFSPDQYPANWFYEGNYDLQKHYYREIGELKDEGEEFACAQFIDRLPKVKHWVRNLDRRGF